MSGGKGGKTAGERVEPDPARRCLRQVGGRSVSSTPSLSGSRKVSKAIYQSVDGCRRAESVLSSLEPGVEVLHHGSQGDLNAASMFAADAGVHELHIGLFAVWCRGCARRRRWNKHMLECACLAPPTAVSS
jgi:hypothetical protein